MLGPSAREVETTTPKTGLPEIHKDGEREVPTVALDYPGANIRLVATSDAERQIRARACHKEPWTVRWIETELGSGGVFYDVGANVGAYSLIAAMQPVPPVTFAFEPGFRTFSSLCDNVHLNGCAETITPLPIALAGQSGLRRFRFKTLEAGQSRHRLAPAPDLRWKGLTQQVPVASMDDLVALCGLAPPTHLKLDVDGAELEVLQGATATLGRPELRSLLVEIDEALWEPVLTLLDGAGFLLREQHQRKPTAPRYAILDRRGSAPRL
jgi:FkbM family methyltransferase